MNTRTGSFTVVDVFAGWSFSDPAMDSGVAFRIASLLGLAYKRKQQDQLDDVATNSNTNCNCEQCEYTQCIFLYYNALSNISIFLVHS